MASDNAGVAPADCAGPSSPPPSLPEGWLAQWEGSSRRWYFVQRTTGKSQWEVPTEPLVPTPTTTPLPGSASPYPEPQSQNDRTARGDMGGSDAHGDGADRGILTNKLFGSQSNMPFMQGQSGSHGGHSGSHSGGHTSVTQMAGGFLGKVANHALNGKPNTQQEQGGHSNTQGHGYGGSSGHGGHSQGILPAIGHSLFGQGHHHQQPNQFNYSSSGQTSSSYAGVAPQYQAPGQTDNQPAGPNISTPSSQPHAQPGGQPQSGAQQQHGQNFSQHVGIDAHGSLSSQFASRPPIPGPPSQPPSHIAPPPGLSQPNAPHQYQGVSNAGYQPGVQAANYPSFSQPQWSQGQSIPADQGHGALGQGQHPGVAGQNTAFGVGNQQSQGNPALPHGQPQPFSHAHGTQVPSSGGYAQTSTNYNQPQQTNQFGQPITTPPGINPQHAPQPTGQPPHQQQSHPNINQVNAGGAGGLNHPQTPHNQHQYQNQYTPGVQQNPVYGQGNPNNHAGMAGNNPYPTNTSSQQFAPTAAAAQPYTSQAHQYDAYKPQAPVVYGSGQHGQEQAQPSNPTGNNSPNHFANQYQGGNLQQQQHAGVPYAGQYGIQQGNYYGGAPGT